jgi:hypothetical protein
VWPGGEEAVEAEVGKEAAEGRRGCGWVRTEECAGGCKVWTGCNIIYQRKRDHNHQKNDRRSKIAGLFGPTWASLLNVFFFFFNYTIVR